VGSGAASMVKYDAIVLGLGAMGSAAVYQLARRGARVLGLDRFAPPHAAGSSHGESRITRLAVGEGAHYSPLVRRSHEIWREIERETGASLLTQNGGLIVSSRNKTALTHVDAFFDNTVTAAEEHGIAHERLDAAQIRRRFPAFAVKDDEFGYYEPEAGFVRPEACVAAQLELARKHGAEIHLGEDALGFDAASGGVTVTTDKARYAADRLIVAAGAWLPQLVGAKYSPLFKIYRQTLFWFEIEGDVAPFRPDRLPIFIWELQRTRQGIYGFPAIDGARSIKIATEQYAATTAPDAVAEVTPEEIAAMHRDFVAPWLAGVSSRCVRTATCLYTVTPDFGFVIDVHPDSERIILASPCSGHGFKHSAAIGEALADMAQGREGAFDLTPFRLSRFSSPSP
jgi:sarcosine oxidase